VGGARPRSHSELLTRVACKEKRHLIYQWGHARPRSHSELLTRVAFEE
jgi:hypothetical protein